MGIGKRELLEDYYMDEIGDVLREWSRLRHPEEDTEEVDAETFLGGEGEWIK